MGAAVSGVDLDNIPTGQIDGEQFDEADALGTRLLSVFHNLEGFFNSGQGWVGGPTYMGELSQVPKLLARQLREKVKGRRRDEII